MPIYGKNPSKIFFSGTSGPNALELGMYRWGLGSITVYSDNDPRLTLTCFRPRSKLVTGFCMGKSENNGFVRNNCRILYQSL